MIYFSLKFSKTTLKMYYFNKLPASLCKTKLGPQKSKLWVIVPPRAVPSLGETIQMLLKFLFFNNAAPSSNNLPPPSLTASVFSLLGFIFMLFFLDYG